MTRTLRRLVAGTVVLGALVASAPQASAAQCFEFEDPRGRIWRVCL